MTHDELPDGCLGCLLDLHLKGQLSDDDLHDLISLQQAQLMRTITCPVCKGTAFISHFEPDCAHCADCSVYLTVVDGKWTPFRQGAVIPRREGT